VAEDSRGRVIQEIHPRRLNDGARHPTGFPMFQSNRTAGRQKSKTEQDIDPRGKFQWWRDQGVGADFFNSIQVGVKPNLTALQPANSRRCPRISPIIERGHRGVPGLGALRRMTQQETQTNRHWSPVFGGRKTDSGKVQMISVLRQLNFAWVQPFRFKTDNFRTVGACLNPHLTWGAVVDLSNFFFQPKTQNRQLANRGRMPVPEPPSDVVGRVSMDSPTIRPALLPLLVGPTGPSCGEDIAKPGSSPD